jgi:hypothetical protein
VAGAYPVAVLVQAASGRSSVEQHMPDRRCVKPHMRLLIIHATMITGHHSQRPSHY